MAAKCGWCTHPERDELEARALQRRESMRRIAADSGVSERAAWRHLKNHLRPDLKALLENRGVSVAARDFGDRLVELLDAAASVREEAERNGEGQLVLKAVATERDTIGVLLSRLGITSEGVLGGLHEAEALAMACSRVLGNHAEALHEIAADLRAHAHDDMANALVQAAVRHRNTPTPRQELTTA